MRSMWSQKVKKCLKKFAMFASKKPKKFAQGAKQFFTVVLSTKRMTGNNISLTVLNQKRKKKKSITQKLRITQKISIT